MEGIPNNLKPEIKEETEEEKIDIENHFHPIISSCEEDQLTRSVCYPIHLKHKIKHGSSRIKGVIKLYHIMIKAYFSLSVHEVGLKILY
jgi:hypothetical protein